jgi:molybdenum cofactor cytidylyltransferase
MSDLPVLDPATSAETPDREVTVAGVLLAAGESSRFRDGNKLLARVDGEPIVRRAARTLLESDCAPLLVVVGHEAERVREALSDLPFETVENDEYARGQATSVRAAVEALSDREDPVDAAVFALGDMPFVAPESVRRLVAVYRDGRATAVAAASDGERGNPVLFDARYFGRLADVEGDVGGRELLREGGDAALVETGDSGVRADIDTVSDLRDARE